MTGDSRRRAAWIVAFAELGQRSDQMVRCLPVWASGVGATSAEKINGLLRQLVEFGTAEDAVVERLIGDRLLRELTLGVFMAVQAQLGVIREIATELEKERREIPVDGVDVVVVHHCRRFDDPRGRLAGPRATPLLGAEEGSPHDLSKMVR
jgi:hypothetical protein